MLTNLFVVVLVLFTSGGPGVITRPVEDKETCDAVAELASGMVGQKIDAPNGEKVTVLDAQGKCLLFTQGTQASK